MSGEAKNYESSSSQVENKLISSILEGEFSSGSILPPERELAASLGVARPTLREALGRLRRDGWVTIRKGQPALVNDFWREGNLNTLVNIVQNTDRFTNEFIVHLLEVRAALTPVFIGDAVGRSPARVVAVLAESSDLEDSSSAFAQFDWNLQKRLSALSGNPIFLLILNSFDAIYIQLARQYFSRQENRMASRKFYRELLAASMASDPTEAVRVTMEVMEKSIALWRNHSGENAPGA